MRITATEMHMCFFKLKVTQIF